MKNWLYNNKVVITGASSGIGKALTKLLINKYNCCVLGIARGEDKLKKLQIELGENKNKFNYFVADVSLKQSWEDIFEKIKNDGYKIFINNAGTMHQFLKAENIDDSKINQVFNINFWSIVYCYKNFVKYVKKTKLENCGLINITSSSSLCCIPGESIYSSSKSAATMFSKIVSSEAKKNFFVGTYLPGFTKTELFNSKDNLQPVFDEKSKKIVNKFCMNSDKLAKKICKSISNKKRYKEFGFDTKILKVLNKILPNKSGDLYLKVFKKTKLQCFDDLNK